MRHSASVVAIAATAVGCGGSDIYYSPIGAAAPTVIRTVPIATNVVVTPDEPGLGAGMFVDYMAGGSWRIQTTCNVNEKLPCDYDPSQKCAPPPCPWDVVATALSGSLEVGDAAIDPGDRIFRVNDGAVRLMLDTEAEVDSVHLTAEPGAKLQVDVFLDYFYDATRVSWAGEDGTIETNGAPSNPVVFLPTAP
jgi:hypothetical protein